MVWHKHGNKKRLKKLTDLMNVLRTSPSVRCNQYLQHVMLLSILFSRVAFDTIWRCVQSIFVPVMFSVLSVWMLLILQVRDVREEVKLWKIINTDIIHQTDYNFSLSGTTTGSSGQPIPRVCTYKNLKLCPIDDCYCWLLWYDIKHILLNLVHKKKQFQSLMFFP